MGRIRMPEGKKIACCFCFDIDALALWLGFFRFPTANPLSRGEFGPRVAMPRILNILELNGSWKRSQSQRSIAATSSN